MKVVCFAPDIFTARGYVGPSRRYIASLCFGNVATIPIWYDLCCFSEACAYWMYQGCAKCLFSWWDVINCKLILGSNRFLHYVDYKKHRAQTTKAHSPFASNYKLNFIKRSVQSMQSVKIIPQENIHSGVVALTVIGLLNYSGWNNKLKFEYTKFYCKMSGVTCYRHKPITNVM